MAKVMGRYNRVKRNAKKSKDAEDSWSPPPMWSDKRQSVCIAAVNSVEEVARHLEQTWGIGKLERLASPELAVKFEQARQNFSDAANGDDTEYLVLKANNLIKGWKALERHALNNGHTPHPPDAGIWYAIAPEDVGGYTFAFIKDSADAFCVDMKSASRIYTLDEICRIVASWENQWEAVRAVKDHFPKSTITAIRPKEELIEDEIPF